MFCCLLFSRHPRHANQHVVVAYPGGPRVGRDARETQISMLWWLAPVDPVTFEFRKHCNLQCFRTLRWPESQKATLFLMLWSQTALGNRWPWAARSNQDETNTVSKCPVRGFTRFGRAKPRVLSCFLNFRCKNTVFFEAAHAAFTAGVRSGRAKYTVDGPGQCLRTPLFRSPLS